MPSPLTSQIASQIYSGLKSIFLDATLTRDTIVASPDYDPADPPAPTPVDYACLAIKDNYTRFDMAGGLILVGDVKILILAGSITVTPAPQDRVTIQGATFTLIDVVTDPATALWTCQGRA